MAGPSYTIIPGDSTYLEWVINDLSSRIIDEEEPLSGHILADGSRPFTGGVLPLGDPDVDGSWQITWTADSLIIEHKESGAWAPKIKWP